MLVRVPDLLGLGKTRPQNDECAGSKQQLLASLIPPPLLFIIILVFSFNSLAFYYCERSHGFAIRKASLRARPSSNTSSIILHGRRSEAQQGSWCETRQGEISGPPVPAKRAQHRRVPSRLVRTPKSSLPCLHRGLRALENMLSKIVLVLPNLHLLAKGLATGEK